jgi:EF hand
MPHSKCWLALGSLAMLAVACAETPKHAEMANAKGSNIPTPPNVDRSKCDEKGKNVVTADTNLDQKPDVWKFYQSVESGGQKIEVLTCKEVDLNHDGKIDLVYYYDDKGVVSMDEADTDFDGKFDMTVYYAGGKKVREEFDTNFDGRPDVWKYFEDEKLVRQERDTNNDGKVDEWEYYEAGKLDRIGYDTTGNGTVNKWDRAPEGEDTEAGGGAAPAAGNGATAPAAPAAPAAPPPATSPPPAKAAAPAKPAPAKK